MKSFIFKIVGLAFLMIAIGEEITAKSQDLEDKKFVFEKQLDNADNINVSLSLFQGHYLGDEIARKLLIIQELYTHTVPGTPTNPGTQTIIDKPNIYYGIKKIDKYYKRAIRKDDITEEQARKEFRHFLNIGISIVHQDTEEFEEFLKNNRKREETVEAFSTVKLK